MSELHDDFSRTPVGVSGLRPWWYLMIIEMGVMISIPIFVLGGQLGLGLKFTDLVLATFSGAAILGVIGALTARLGTVTRCSTALIARTTFGCKGASVVALILTMGMTGWWGVQTEMFANAIVQLANQLFHVNFSREITILVGGTAMITTAALGIRAIGRLSYLAVPLLVGGMVYALSSAFQAGKFNLLMQFQPAQADLITVGAGAATVAGGFIVGASMNPDYSRFARTKAHALAYSISDYAVIYPLLLIACGVIGVAFQTKDIMIHLVPSSLSWIIFLMMMFATWAANDCNLYSSSLSLAAVLPRLKRSHLAILAGLAGIALAEFHIAGHMVSFLTLLGILIAPISGVFVISAIGNDKATTEQELSSVKDWHFAQLFSWLAGAFVGYAATSKDALGLGWITLTTIPTLDSLLAGGAVMLLVRLLSKVWIERAEPAAVVVPATVSKD